MDTVYLADAIEQPIREGDLVFNETGRLFFVIYTENSFIRQGFVRVQEARLGRRGYTVVEGHAYLQGQFAIRVDPDLVPLDIKKRQAYFQQLQEPTRPARRKALRERFGRRTVAKATDDLPSHVYQ